MGRWSCRYHPGEYIVEKGYTCCRQRVRPLRYNPNYVLLGAHEQFVKPPAGCTPCDCGTDLSRIHIPDIQEVLDQIDVSKWEGVDFPYLYRSRDSFENRATQ